MTSKDDPEHIYIKSKNWGLTGDSQTTIISADDEREFKVDSTKDFVYNGLDPFIYQVHQDTLLIYTPLKGKDTQGL